MLFLTLLYTVSEGNLGIYILQKQSCYYSTVFGCYNCVTSKFYERSAGKEFMQWEPILESLLTSQRMYYTTFLLG